MTNPHHANNTTSCLMQRYASITFLDVCSVSSLKYTKKQQAVTGDWIRKHKKLQHVCHLIINSCSDSCNRLHGYPGVQKAGVCTSVYIEAQLPHWSSRASSWCLCKQGTSDIDVKKSNGLALAPQWDRCQETPVLRHSFKVLKKTLYNHNICP